jgi:hypothetical protein
MGHPWPYHPSRLARREILSQTKAEGARARLRPFKITKPRMKAGFVGQLYPTRSRPAFRGRWFGFFFRWRWGDGGCSSHLHHRLSYCTGVLCLHVILPKKKIHYIKNIILANIFIQIAKIISFGYIS